MMKIKTEKFIFSILSTIALILFGSRLMPRKKRNRSVTEEDPTLSIESFNDSDYYNYRDY